MNDTEDRGTYFQKLITSTAGLRSAYLAFESAEPEIERMKDLSVENSLGNIA